MVRSKIRYELVADERTHSETFKKRKVGFFKKLDELKTLCGVEACAIVINGDETPSFWPSQIANTEISQRFRKLPPYSRTRNMVDQNKFLKRDLSKLSKNLDKETKKVQSLEKDLILAECISKDEVNMNNSRELHKMLCLLERKMGMIDNKIAEVVPSGSNMAANDKLYHRKGKHHI